MSQTEVFSVKGFLQDIRSGEYLTLQRAAGDIRGGALDLLGGEIEADEDVVAAFCREAGEEAGPQFARHMVIEEFNPETGLFPDERRSKYGHQNIRYFVWGLCDRSAVTLELNPEEHSRVVWLPQNLLPEKLGHDVQRHAARVLLRAS